MKVLLVDDDIAYRSALRRCFATQGWTVDVAAEETSASARLRDDVYDIVVVAYTKALAGRMSRAARDSSLHAPRDARGAMGASGGPSHDSPDVLTPRQVEVLECLNRGMANKEIAATLGFSVKSAEYHVGQILRKTGCSSRSEVLARNRESKARGRERAEYR